MRDVADLYGNSPPSTALASFGIYLAWHPRVDADPASAWFRAKVLAAMRTRAVT